jgi:hypothetical protein
VILNPHGRLGESRHIQFELHGSPPAVRPGIGQSLDRPAVGWPTASPLLFGRNQRIFSQLRAAGGGAAPGGAPPFDLIEGKKEASPAARCLTPTALRPHPDVGRVIPSAA